MVNGCQREENLTMNDLMQGGMAEVMRLMQKGELAEATAVIQRTLGGSSLGSESAPSGADEPIVVESSVVEEAPHSGASLGMGAAPQPNAAPLLLGSLPLTMPDGLTLTMP